jgi:chromate reductase, NAD(P)H dehydrogenase (quinone)
VLKKISVLVGSLRRDAITRKIATALSELASNGLALDIVPIGALPLYNQDLETEKPPADWNELRARIASAHGVLFVTPEYNRSISAALKNAIEVASRPYGKSVLDGKPAAVISSSPGLLGGALAGMHLRQILTNCGCITLQQPEVYLSQADKLFDADGKLIVTATAEFLAMFLSAFANLVEKNS